jgi:hypothetical protein
LHFDSDSNNFRSFVATFAPASETPTTPLQLFPGFLGSATAVPRLEIRAASLRIGAFWGFPVVHPESEGTWLIDRSQISVQPCPQLDRITASAIRAVSRIKIYSR